MKVAVTLFGENKDNVNKIVNKFDFLVQNAKMVFCVAIFAMGFICFLSSFGISSSIFKLGTNFFIDDDDGIKIADVIGVFALYNEDNYVFNNNENNNNINVADNDIDVPDEIKIIDKAAILDETVEAFFSKEPNISITQSTSTLQRISIGNMKILNYSSKRDIDFAKLLDGVVTLTKKSDKILLYNTHTSESYTNSPNYTFEYDGVMRSRNAEYNMLAIAKELDKNLRDKNINSVQNTTPHDYGTYTSAYSKSRMTIESALSNMGGAGLIIDVHRDATADLGYRPVANINGVQVAQCMFVVGVGTDSNKNEYWEDNLRLALKLQMIADKIYPGLFRPMYIRNSIYNQDLNKYSLLIEFGATGNTIEEVKLTTRCITNLLNIIYKD